MQPAQAMAGPVARERNVERRSEEIQPQDLARRRHAPHLRADPELVEPGDAQGRDEVGGHRLVARQPRGIEEEHALPRPGQVDGEGGPRAPRPHDDRVESLS